MKDQIYFNMVAAIRATQEITNFHDIDDYVEIHHKARLRVESLTAIFMDFESQEDEMAWVLKWG